MHRWLLVFFLGGCGGCKGDHPFVPYGIEDGEATQVDALAAAMEAGPSLEQSALIAPPNVTQWKVDGLDLTAPPGSVFALGLTHDFDADGRADAVALVRAADDPNDLGRALYFHATTAGLAAAFELPLGMPTLAHEDRCIPTRRMSVVGKQSLYAELGFQCPIPSARDASRFATVIAIAPKVRTHFATQIIDPPNAPRLTLDVDASDRDADGLDDATVHVTIDGGTAPFEPLVRTTATLRWFDRPTGMSREREEPEASLRALASVAATRASKPKDAPQAPNLARAIKVLYSAMCAEGGAPRLKGLIGEPVLTCGVSHALEEANLAEVRAFATSGEIVRAIAMLDRAQIPPASKTANRTTDAQAWIAQVAPIATMFTIRQLAAVPLIERGKQPAWGALSFEPSGKLLIRTAAGVVRADPELGDETEARDVSPWSMSVMSPDGNHRWLEAYNPCDGVALHATLAPTAEGDMVDLALPILPAMTSKCSGKGDAVPSIALAWGAGGLEGVVMGEPTLMTISGKAAPLRSLLGQPTTHGSPRSPDGKSFALSTSLGVLVVATKSKIVKPKEWESAFAELRDCTTSDDTLRVACVRSGRVYVAIPVKE